MTDTKATVEKRKHNRFTVQEGAYAALVNGSAKVGKIINISKGGVSFIYIGEEAKITGWHKMIIFLHGNRFYLKEITFKAISDSYIDPKTPLSKVLMKQCGGQFDKMTSSQIVQLDYTSSPFLNPGSIEAINMKL